MNGRRRASYMIIRNSRGPRGRLRTPYARGQTGSQKEKTKMSSNGKSMKRSLRNWEPLTKEDAEIVAREAGKALALDRRAREIGVEAALREAGLDPEKLKEESRLREQNWRRVQNMQSAKTGQDRRVAGQAAEAECGARAQGGNSPRRRQSLPRPRRRLPRRLQPHRRGWRPRRRRPSRASWTTSRRKSAPSLTG